MLTNAKVAHRFVSAMTKGRSGTMTIYPSAFLAHKFLHSQFEVLSTLESYSTRIAMLVRNRLQHHNELWLTPTFYSQTTQRHFSEVKRAWREVESDGAQTRVFTTMAVEHGCPRNECEADYTRAINGIKREFDVFNSPQRLHGTTRDQALSNIIARGEHFTRITSEKVNGVYQPRIWLDEVAVWVDHAQRMRKMELPEARVYGKAIAELERKETHTGWTQVTV